MAHHWEQVNAVHFCTRLGKTPAETQDLLLQAYQQEALRKGTAKAYYSRFQKGGNSFPDTYGRRSIGNVKNKSNKKEVCDVIDSNSREFESEGNGFPSDLDINLHLQWDNTDSIDVHRNPSTSEIKKFLKNIECSCNEHLKPQKLRISTNQDSVLDAEVDNTTLPEEFEESEPMQEVNEDSAMEDTVSSSFLNNGDGEVEDIMLTSDPILETVEDTISSSLPTNETVEDTMDSCIPVYDIVEDPISSTLPDNEEVEDLLSFSETTYDTVEDTTCSSPEPSEIVDEDILEDTTIPVEDVISFNIPIDESVEEPMSSSLPNHETLEDELSSSLISDEICVTTKKTRRVSTPRKRKTRINCRCPTCRLKF